MEESRTIIPYGGSIFRPPGLCAALQKEIGGEEGWDKFCEPRVPTEWSFSNRAINNGQGTLSGSVKMANGQSLTVDLTLVKEDNAWKLVGVKFS